MRNKRNEEVFLIRRNTSVKVASASIRFLLVSSDLPKIEIGKIAILGDT